MLFVYVVFFFFSSRRRHTRFKCDWGSDVCSSDLVARHIILSLGTRRTGRCERDCQPRANPCLAKLHGHGMSSRQYVPPAFRRASASGQQFAEKPKTMSFRGTLRAEESLFLLIFKLRKFPHFVRNDRQSTFSATRSSEHVLGPNVPA